MLLHCNAFVTLPDKSLFSHRSGEGLEGDHYRDHFGSSVELVLGVSWRDGRCHLSIIPEQKERQLLPAAPVRKVNISLELASGPCTYIL